MSNQVFANNTSRYFPAVEQRDILTLTKNNVGPPPYGTLAIAASQDGRGIYMNRLNGIDLVAVNGVFPYGDAQTSYTKPYWTLGSNATVLSGALTLTSLVANAVAFNIVITGVMSSSSTTTGTLTPNIKVMAMLMNSVDDFENAKCVQVVDRSVSVVYPTPSPPPNPSPWAFSGVVDMLPGQVLGIFIFVRQVDFTYTLTMKDDTNSTADKIVIENSISFYKL